MSDKNWWCVRCSAWQSINFDKEPLRLGCGHQLREKAPVPAIHHKINQRALNQFSKELLEMEQYFDFRFQYTRLNHDKLRDSGQAVFEDFLKCSNELRHRHWTAHMLELSFKLHDTETISGYMPTSRFTEDYYDNQHEHFNDADFWEDA